MMQLASEVPSRTEQRGVSRRRVSMTQSTVAGEWEGDSGAESVFYALAFVSVGECRDMITRLERSLANMERAPMKFKIGEGEINRRKGLLTSVRTDSDRLESDLNGGGSSGRAARRPVNLADESLESQQQSNVQIHAQQRSALSAQDEKLDGILDGVSRLKVMSNDINQELDLHAGLLTELDSAVDSTDARLQRNTKRIEIVQEQSGGCCGMLTMAVLLGLIIMLLVTNWACHIFKPSKC
jgi:hypothetical protein